MAAKHLTRFVELYPHISQTWASGWLYEQGNTHAYLAHDPHQYGKVKYFFMKLRAVWILSRVYAILEGKLWRIQSETKTETHYERAAYSI